MFRPEGGSFKTNDHTKYENYEWNIYVCSTCGRAVLHGSWLDPYDNRPARTLGIFPGIKEISREIPDTPRKYLCQAVRCLHSPDGAVMLASSAVDAMLKSKGLSNGSLYSRIDEAKNQHLVTTEMAEWAHEVRLHANDVRHADLEDPHQTLESAARVVEFAEALAEFLFVLPARITRGRQGAAS